MTDVLAILLKITVMIFMAGSLLELGLRVNLKGALGGLRDVRFVTRSLLWAFVLCPALAYALTLIFPLTPSFAMGLILLSLAPCAPLLPMLADKARADLNYAATFMLLASAVTVVYMPVMVPLLVNGLSVSAWTVAKPASSRADTPVDRTGHPIPATVCRDPDPTLPQEGDRRGYPSHGGPGHHHLRQGRRLALFMFLSGRRPCG